MYRYKAYITDLEGNNPKWVTFEIDIKLSIDKANHDININKPTKYDYDLWKTLHKNLRLSADRKDYLLKKITNIHTIKYSLPLRNKLNIKPS